MPVSDAQPVRLFDSNVCPTTSAAAGASTHEPGEVATPHADSREVCSEPPNGPANGGNGSAEARDERGRFTRGNPNRWLPGQSGNPHGRRRGTVSFAGALARHALVPVGDREEMAKLARVIGLDPAEANNLDVVCGLFYVTLCRLLLRAANADGRVDERLVGMLTVLLRALDPAEVRLSGPNGGPIPIAAVIADVQTALGMRRDAADPLIRALPGELDLSAAEAAQHALTVE